MSFLIDHTKKTLDYFDKNEIDNTRLFILGFLERLFHASITLKLIIPAYKKEVEHEYSLGIILRSLLLDNLIILSVYKTLKDNKNISKNEQFRRAAKDAISNNV